MAFWECNSLTSIVIPKSVTIIGENAFVECRSLNTVFYTGSVTNWNSVNKETSSIKDEMLVYYSETQPTDTTYNYWHYVDDVPTIWSENN